MTSSIFTKGLFAGLTAVAIAGAAVAQSTPPNAAAKDPAVGAGQQSTQSTPMGTTGTPANSGSSSTMGASGSTGSSSSMGASGSTGSSSATTDSSTSSGSTASNSGDRATKADRN